MSKEHGNLSINSQNIFPIIKKWMYSDHDIFYRELVSNACDAITKLKKLSMIGEYEAPDDIEYKVEIKLSAKDKTIKIIDNGIGMTKEEVDEYINQIAFSGAEAFLEKYKDKANDDQIIGHFGLGFYSAFMVADQVTIDTLSFKDGAESVHWSCDGGTEYDISEGTKTTPGTEITLYLNEDSYEFANEYKAKEVLDKYCSFMPVPIFVTNEDAGEQTEEIPEEEVTEKDTVLDTFIKDAVTEEVEKEDGTKETVEKVPAKKMAKIVKRPVAINNIHPLWTKHPNECSDEDYKEFYRKVFHDYKEPLFWIHLNMDYPFNLKGILYFPKINTEYESIEGTIKLYNNQVFVADNIKEVIPEFLLLLKGVIDCPDLPLNVSRSALQNDGFVKKISDYITKKVADKLSGMCKTDKENYEKYWDDINPFIKFGCLKDDKFCEKMTDYILFKNLDGEYMTLPECLEVKKVDSDEEENKDQATDAETGEKVEAEVVDENKDDEQVDIPTEDSETKEKIIYYVTDLVQQSQYVNMFKKAKMDAVVLPDRIDQPFVSQLEAKNQGIKFARIDADLTETFKTKNSKKVEEELAKKSEEISALFKKAIKKDNITVKVEKLKNKDISSMITVSEEARRMQDMMKMYAMNGMDMGMNKEGETLILNANNKLVEYVLEHQDGENVGLICEQLYDLALLQQAPLQPDAMTKFIARSNKIMMLLAQ